MGGGVSRVNRQVQQGKLFQLKYFFIVLTHLCDTAQMCVFFRPVRVSGLWWLQCFNFFEIWSNSCECVNAGGRHWLKEYEQRIISKSSSRRRKFQLFSKKFSFNSFNFCLISCPRGDMIWIWFFHKLPPFEIKIGLQEDGNHCRALLLSVNLLRRL